MQRGNDPAILWTPTGEIMAIATGADGACAEHDCGSEPMLSALTGKAVQSKRDIAQALRRGVIENVPRFLDQKRIVADLDSLFFTEMPREGLPQAILVYGVRREPPTATEAFDNQAIRFTNGDRDYVGAWDSASFGFRVRGAKLVTAFREFVEELKSGKGIFAGLFLQDVARGLSGLSGVVIAIEDLLRPEDRAAMAAAEQDFAAGVRLELAARTDELTQLAGKLPKGRSITHIWPVWRGGVVDGEVAYRLNPGMNVSVRYGEYDFDTLRNWLAEGAAVTI